MTPPDLIISLAVDTANRGPCAKSKRGVVIYDLGTPERAVPYIHGNAFNSQPWPFECNASDACKAACGRLCVHAEQRAIMQMLRPNKIERVERQYETPKPDLQLVHVKTVDGKLVPSTDGPSCDQCSKLIVEAGIRTVWLYADEGAWSCWDATMFHQATLRHLKLPVTL